MPQYAAAMALAALLFTTALLAIDRTIAGAVQCHVLSCLNA